MSRQTFPEHPCKACERPTTNRVTCNRNCTLVLARRNSPVLKPGPRTHWRTSVKERFLRFVPDRPENDCWIWYGSKSGDGYPEISDVSKNRKRKIGAHRLSWEIFRGPIPKGHVVGQSCENAECTNPKHLVCGTRSKVVGGRLRRNKKGSEYGQTNPSAVLTDLEVKIVKRLHSERRFDEIGALAESKGMNREYVVAIGRAKGRCRDPRRR